MFIFYIKDPYGLNEGIYTIQKYIKQMNYEPFNNRIYFMCTNGQYTGEDELGYLMHDFNCSDYKDMILEEMRESVKKLKTNENEVENMCQIMEELVENGRLQGLNEGILQGNLKGKLEISISTAHNLYEMGLGLDQIAKALDSDINQVKEWLSIH